MADDLVARCAAEVRLAMEHEPYDCVERLGAACAPELDCLRMGHHNLGCMELRENRLAATLGRMMAAGIEHAVLAMAAPPGMKVNWKDVALRAVARERGGTA